MGKVSCNGVKVKPSREVKEGEVYELNIDRLHKRVKIKQLLANRVGAKEVEKYMEDLTPQEEYERLQIARSFVFEVRDRGIGRPSKKDRRLLESFKQESYED